MRLGRGRRSRLNELPAPALRVADRHEVASDCRDGGPLVNMAGRWQRDLRG
jgi:hypothetical protein